MKYSIFFSALILFFFANSCKDEPPTKSEQPPEELIYDTTSHNITWFADTLGDYGQELNDIWAADSVNFYAVGKINISSDPNRLWRGIIKWNGSEWVDVPNIGRGESNELGIGGQAIFGFGNNDIWVARTRRLTNGAAPGGLGVPFSHYNGVEWKTYFAPYPSPTNPYTNPNLYDMWGSDPNHLWAVGDSGLVYFWNGSVWTKQAVPQEVTPAFRLYSIHGYGANDVYVSGLNPYSDESMLLHYNGTSWQVIEHSQTPSSSSPYYMGEIYCAKWRVGNKEEEKVYLLARYFYEWDRKKYPNERRWEKVEGVRNQEYNWGFLNGVRGSMLLTGGPFMAYWNGKSWKDHGNVLSRLYDSPRLTKQYHSGKTSISVGYLGGSFQRPIYFIAKVE